MRGRRTWLMGCGGAGLRAAGVELGFGGVLQLTGLSKSGLPPMAFRTLAALFMCLRHGRGTSAAWYRGGRGRVRHEHATVNARGQEQGSGAGMWVVSILVSCLFRAGALGPGGGTGSISAGARMRAGIVRHIRATARAWCPDGPRRRS